MNVTVCEQCGVPLDADEVLHCKTCLAESLAFEFDEDDFKAPFEPEPRVEGDTGEEQDPD